MACVRGEDLARIGRFQRISELRRSYDPRWLAARATQLIPIHPIYHSFLLPATKTPFATRT